MEVKQRLGKKIVTIGNRVIEFWIDDDGIHCEDVDVVSGKFIPHSEQVLSYSDALAKAEHQLIMPI